MAANKIKITKSRAVEKLNKQISKGSVFAKTGSDFIKNHPDHSSITYEIDKFKIDIDQWVEITRSILFEIFDSSVFGHKFYEIRASKEEYVSSSWHPDIKYYITNLLIPKLNYLKSLSINLEDLDELSQPEIEIKDAKPESNISIPNQSEIQTIKTKDHDFSKMTFPQLFSILTISQVAAIISSAFAILVIAFWIGYYFHSFQSNKSLNNELNNISKEVQILNSKYDSLLTVIQKLKSDSTTIEKKPNGK